MDDQVPELQETSVGIKPAPYAASLPPESQAEAWPAWTPELKPGPWTSYLSNSMLGSGA